MLMFYAVTATQLINMYNIKCAFFPNEEATIYIELRNRIPVSFIKSILDQSDFKYIHIMKDAGAKARIGTSKTIPYKNVNKSYLSKLRDILNKTYYHIKIVPLIGYLVSYIGGIAWALYYIYSHNSYFQKMKFNQNISHYSHIFVGTCGLSQVIAIKQLINNTNNVHLCIVDEGTTNYCLDKYSMCLQSSSNFTNNIGYKLLRIYYHLDANYYNGFINMTDSQYLYCPMVYPYLNQYVLFRIPLIDKNNPKVFSLVKNSVSISDIREYVDRHVYFLLQMPNISFEKCLREILSAINHDNLILKEHPEFHILDNQYMNLDFTSVFVDTRADAFIFEALLTHIDFNNRVIITEFSSAAFTPKFMFDVEPYVVFLYNIIDKEKPDMIKSWELQKNALVNLYRNPEKIYAPKSMDELHVVLKEVSIIISPNTIS